MPTLRKSNGVASIRIRMIGQQVFAAALSYDMKFRTPHQMLYAWDRRSFDQQIISFGLAP